MYIHMSCSQSNTSPYLNANKWSKFFHSWVADLFDRCAKQGTLYLEDLYDLLPNYQAENLTEQLENNWFEELKQFGKNSNLFRATIRTIRWKALIIGSILIPQVCRFNNSFISMVFFEFRNY